MTDKLFKHDWLDQSDMPLIRLTYPPNATDEEISDFYNQLIRWYHTVDSGVAWVIDCSSVKRATPRQRKIISESEKQMVSQTAQYNVGTAIIISNSLVRGFVTAVYWISGPKYPYKFFSDIEEATHWANQKLVEAKHSLRT